jgi:hypothetical protein
MTHATAATTSHGVGGMHVAPAGLATLVDVADAKRNCTLVR